MIQSKPSEKGEIITYLSRMGDVLDDIAEGCELVVAMGTVYTVIHRNKVNIMFRKHDLGIHTDLQIITPETRHIFDDNTLDKACLNICNHLLKARAVKGRTGNAIINIEFEVGISVFKSILLQDFFWKAICQGCFSPKNTCETTKLSLIHI